MTTRGRRTGLPREIEIWFTERAGKFYVISEHPTSHWVRNLQADPAVQVRVGNRRFSAKARVISPELEHELHTQLSELSRQKYGWGEGLLVEITPD